MQCPRWGHRYLCEVVELTGIVELDSVSRCVGHFNLGVRAVKVVYENVLVTLVSA